MRAVIQSRLTLRGVLSASAIERVGAFWFVAGDNSIDLYRLDDKQEIVGRTRLQEAAAEGSVEKHAKLDLEAATLVNWQGRQELLLFGSGSKRVVRDSCFRVDVSKPDEPKLLGSASLTALFDVLRAEKAFVGSQKLNVEGAATDGESLLLFQRGNISGVSSIAEFNLASFMAYLDQHAAGVPPKAAICSVVLPKLQDQFAGFSSATTLGAGRILFAASVEGTPDEIDDGPLLGSFVGLVEKRIGEAGWALKWTALVEAPEGSARVKIEGISCERTEGLPATIVGVTDSDGGASEWLAISLLPSGATTGKQ